MSKIYTKQNVPKGFYEYTRPGWNETKLVEVREMNLPYDSDLVVDFCEGPSHRPTFLVDVPSDATFTISELRPLHESDMRQLLRILNTEGIYIRVPVSGKGKVTIDAPTLKEPVEYPTLVQAIARASEEISIASWKTNE